MTGNSIDEENTRTISLVVEIPHPRDMYRGIVRIDYDSMDALDISTGSIVEIIGNKAAFARVLPLSPPDNGKGLIRIDELIKENSGANGFKSIKLQKTSALLATDIMVIPLNPVPPGTETYLKDSLDEQPLTKGQRVILPYFGGYLEYRVDDHIPSCNVVFVNKKTKFHITTP